MVVADETLINKWYVVAIAQDCPPGIIKPIRLLQEDLVLWRGDNPQSSIQVWRDWCPHRGTRLSLGKISQERLACAYHGWQYDHSGRCVHIPSLPTQTPKTNVCVKTYHCQERWGYIWVCLGSPEQDIPSLPEWDHRDYRNIHTGPYYFHSSPFRLMESGLDLAHFHFVHGGHLGDPKEAIVNDYDVEPHKDGMTMSNFRCWQQNPDGSGVSSEVVYSQEIYYPLTIHALKTFNDSRRMSWFFTITPIDHEESLAWTCISLNYGHEIPESELVEYYDQVHYEDVPVVESQRPLRLPLETTSETEREFSPETHTRCDRTSIIYRQWLKQTGVTFGVC